jgi:hypothetical protein
MKAKIKVKTPLVEIDGDEMTTFLSICSFTLL